MYFGIYEVRVRAKNRIAFPSKLRKITGDSLFITNWFEKSLLVLPKKHWEEIISTIFKDSSFLSPEVRDLDRFISGGTFEVTLDQEGRFVLPAYLKGFAQIQRSAVFVGGMWYIQLWDEKLFKNYQDMNALQIKDKAIKVLQTTKITK